jgi:catechol 2,3-dioxygenase-like lactoylglutathione lyase family enzyme
VTIELDHLIVPAKNQRTAARQLAELLGVHWLESGLGPFSAVFVNAGLTLDFLDDSGPFQIEHYCFRVTENEFDAILSRIEAAGIKYRSDVRGPENMRIGTNYGSRVIYWNVPEGHQWEMLTASYARQPD